jgi:hypothetical protein
MPLNKKVAITMIHKDDYKKYVDDKDLWYLKISEDNSIEKLNELALDYEKCQNNLFLVGDMNELLKLQKYNKSKKGV